jgi:ribosomal protein S18 acetylase RimI-like enzyme
MDINIRGVRDTDLDALVELTLLAFVPVFDSFQRLLGPAIYGKLWPDWHRSQRRAVVSFCRKPGKRVVKVAEAEGTVVGLVAYEPKPKGNQAEILFLAVHPDYQNRGIGTKLNEHVLQDMTKAGVALAVVDTGGESSHAPARRSYEKAGFVALPLVRYYKVLSRSAASASSPRSAVARGTHLEKL